MIPVLAPLWGLNPQKIGLLISSGFLGQLVGALFFGWVAERFGRMPAMVWSIALFSILSLACAASWNFELFLIFRLLQGIGLGGELQVAAVYIGEVSKAKGRGQSILYYQVLLLLALRVAASWRSGGAASRLAVFVHHWRDTGFVDPFPTRIAA